MGWQEEACKPPDLSEYYKLLRENIVRIEKIIRGQEARLKRMESK